MVPCTWTPPPTPPNPPAAASTRHTKVGSMATTEFLKLQKTQTESNTHNSRFSRGGGKKKFNPNCFLREQQISHRHEEEEKETKPNKKLAQTFLLQQQQQQLVNKGTQQQTNNLKILQHPKIVYKIKKKFIIQIFFF
jgi:hypothetical protein